MIEIKPKEWAIPGTPSYTSWIKKTFNYSDKPSSELFQHQRFVRDFMQGNGPNHGILLYHGLGVGKTRSAVAIAESNLDREVIVLLPASLKPNFLAEVESWQKQSSAKKQTYTLVSYDSSTKSAWINLSFDNKLVIIDEAHTFISRVVGLGNMTSELCQRLLDASNCKVVALTGTPIINNPLELAYMLNLVHGYTYAHVYKFAPSAVVYDAENEIRAMPSVARVFSNTSDKEVTISVVQWPSGFIKIDGEGYLANAHADADDAIHVAQVIKKHGLKAQGTMRRKKVTLFPLDHEEFASTFVNYMDRKAIKTRLFSLKIQGLVSYFESYDTSKFPKAHPIEIVQVPMKKIQFGKYITVRQREIDNEKKTSNKAVDDKNKDLKTGNQYRAFSRAICSFAFPDEIPRPYPSTMKQYNQFVDEFDEDVGPTRREATSKEKDAIFNRAISSALKSLNDKADLYLSREGLAEYGPKILAIFDRLEKCPGTALIYSAFRNVEGLKIITMAMEHTEGYVEIQVKKQKGTKEWKLQCSDFNAPNKYIVFSSKQEETQILLNLFNSELDKLPASIKSQLGLFKEKHNLYGGMCKVLLITQSGAQGISLQNVRQVHIAEPFWNKIRIQQVQGRAIRAGSHVRLPARDREVHTYLYVMTLTAKEQINHTLIKAHDDGLTSDGYILEIANRKSLINDQFLQLLKNSAVDCSLNKAKHGKAVQCFKATKPIFKMFQLVKQFGDRKFLFLANPDKDEIAEFSHGRTGDGWTGLYDATDESTQIGLVKIDAVKGKPTKVVIFDQ